MAWHADANTSRCGELTLVSWKCEGPGLLRLSFTPCNDRSLLDDDKVRPKRDSRREFLSASRLDHTQVCSNRAAVSNKTLARLLALKRGGNNSENIYLENTRGETGQRRTNLIIESCATFHSNLSCHKTLVCMHMIVPNGLIVFIYAVDDVF